jgi:hypothetical protein
MVNVRTILSGLWVCTMLTYLFGDVMRIFAGDFVAGEIDGAQVGQEMYLGMAILFVIPIFMVILALTLKHRVNRWANIIVATVFVAVNLPGLPYPGAYDNFLIVVSFLFNALTIWYAWKWAPETESYKLATG